VVSNLERVDRGLTPLTGLSAGLDPSPEHASFDGADASGPNHHGPRPQAHLRHHVDHSAWPVRPYDHRPGLRSPPSSL
jgi:hypothetical protein